MKKHAAVVISCAVSILLLIVFACLYRWDGLVLTVTQEKVAGLLGALTFAAAAIERGVEVLISPWRDAEANKLESDLDVIRKRPAPADQTTADKNALDLKTASEKLEDYRATTQRHAFAISLTLSVMVSIAGLRTLSPFIDAGALAKLPNDGFGQHGFFVFVDTLLTASLLAGGADGLHSIMNAVTTFFDSTANKAAKS